MRYSPSTGLYALAMSTVLGACDNGAKVPASALEQTVAHAQESSKIDLSTPEKAVAYGRKFIHNGDFQNLKKVMTEESYHAFERELKNDTDLEVTQKLLRNTQFTVISAEYINDTKAKVLVEYTLPDGKKEREKERGKKIGDRWLNY